MLIKITGRTLAFIVSVCLPLTMLGCTDACTDGSNATGNDSDASAISYLADPDMYYGNAFGQGEIIDINVEISEEDWADICANAEEEEYHSADITVNGNTVTNVGFRTKGFSSLNMLAQSDSNRYGFKVKTDEYVDDKTLNGLDMFVLNGSFSDPSYMREYLTYLASAEIGCITPFVAYSRLHINGELFGFYIMIEAYDDSFVERNADSTASLYKADSETCTLTPNDDASGFECKYGEEDDGESIRKLIAALNGTGGGDVLLEEILDVDSVLKSIAINTVMGNYDSYNGSKAHNYYLLEQNGRFTYIGWDYNMSIGGFGEDNGASVSVDIDEPVYNTNIEERPLIGKLLENDAYRQIYNGYIEQLVDFLSDISERVNDISEIIRPYVAEDPTAFYTVEQFDAATAFTGVDVSGNSNGGDGGQVLQGGDTSQTTPNGMEDGMRPPDGGTQPPDGGTQPPDGGMPPDGGIPPDGMTPPDDGGWPFATPGAGGDPGQGVPDGTPPADMEGFPGQGGMGGPNAQREDYNPMTCSILDYLIQRCSIIAEQLT